MYLYRVMICPVVMALYGQGKALKTTHKDDKTLAVAHDLLDQL